MAGFIEGEGSFSVVKQSRGDAYRCSMSLSVRADDQPILDEIAANELPFDSESAGLSRDWGSFLAGYITAEGSFGIQRVARGRFRPAFVARVHRDDVALLGELAARTRVGHVTTSTGSAAWSVTAGRDLLAIVDVFNAHPLAGRKAREYRVWQRAVQLYASDRSRTEIHGALALIYRDLKRARKYQTPSATGSRFAKDRRKS